MASHNPNALNNSHPFPNTANATAVYPGQAPAYYSPVIPPNIYYPLPVAPSSNFINQQLAGAAFGQVPNYVPPHGVGASGRVHTYAPPPPNSGYYPPTAPSSSYTFANPNAPSPSTSYDQSYNNPDQAPAVSDFAPSGAPLASYNQAATTFVQYDPAANLSQAILDYYHPGYYGAGFGSVGYPQHTVYYPNTPAATAHAPHYAGNFPLYGNAVYVTRVYAAGRLMIPDLGNRRPESNIHLQSSQEIGCAICMEDPPTMYTVQGCSHRFCNECMRGHLMFKLSNEAGLPRCPHLSCATVLQPADCEGFLSQELLQKMKDRLEESAIPTYGRVYCPNPTCSALMSKSSVPHDLPTSPFVKCFKCEQYFCLNCLGSYSSDGTAHSCWREKEKSQRMTWELNNVAQNRGWRQCPKCNHMIELLMGCNHITCRCGHEFCYRCGAPRNPFGFGCPCPVWDESNFFLPNW